MMRTRDMMMSGDNLRGNSPFRGCDLFEFERYFDVPVYIYFLCVDIFFVARARVSSRRSSHASR